MSVMDAVAFRKAPVPGHEGYLCAEVRLQKASTNSLAGAAKVRYGDFRKDSETEQEHKRRLVRGLFAYILDEAMAEMSLDENA